MPGVVWRRLDAQRSTSMESQITCGACGAENPLGASFCMSCGSPLARSCPSCGTEAPAQARFCPACGSALDQAATPAAGTASTPQEAAAPPDAVAPSDVRRTVTVLFADLSGYTSVAERLDHETVKALTDRCLTRLAAEVQRFGGHVDKYIGDNVMAVFGAPVAHEDDPERAVRAAFGMQGAMAELNQGIEPEFGFELPLRIGVNTGEVLAGHVGDAYTVVGDAVNVAARLQAAAPVGGTLVGERTFRSTQAAVHYRELEPLTLKGKAEPVSAWGALELRELGRPSERGQTSTPLVGREAELSQLETLYERIARDGAPHLVTLVGQAGVGKTRVLHELEGGLARRDSAPRVLRGRCLAFGSSVVYWPLTEMLRAECEILDGDTSAEVDAKLSGRLGDLLAAREGAEQAERRLI